MHGLCEGSNSHLRQKTCSTAQSSIFFFSSIFQSFLPIFGIKSIGFSHKTLQKNNYPCWKDNMRFSGHLDSTNITEARCELCIARKIKFHLPLCQAAFQSHFITAVNTKIFIFSGQVNLVLHNYHDCHKHIRSVSALATGSNFRGNWA